MRNRGEDCGPSRRRRCRSFDRREAVHRRRREASSDVRCGHPECRLRGQTNRGRAGHPTPRSWELTDGCLPPLCRRVLRARILLRYGLYGLLVYDSVLTVLQDVPRSGPTTSTALCRRAATATERCRAEVKPPRAPWGLASRWRYAKPVQHVTWSTPC